MEVQGLEQQKALNSNPRNKMTEKDYNPRQKQRKAMQKQDNLDKAKKNIPKKIEKKAEAQTKPEEKKIKEEKKVKKQIPKIKKTQASVKGLNIPISTKVARDICKFIKNKKIETAIKELTDVMIKKRAVPMKGEIPHRKGKIMSGGFPKKGAKHFIILLKSLQANADANELNDAIIREAFANLAEKQLGRFGRIKKKRTNIKIIAKEKNKKKPNQKRKKIKEKKK